MQNAPNSLTDFSTFSRTVVSRGRSNPPQPNQQQQGNVTINNYHLFHNEGCNGVVNNVNMPHNARIDPNVLINHRNNNNGGGAGSGGGGSGGGGFGGGGGGFGGRGYGGNASNGTGGGTSTYEFRTTTNYSSQQQPLRKLKTSPHNAHHLYATPAPILDDFVAIGGSKKRKRFTGSTHMNKSILNPNYLNYNENANLIINCNYFIHSNENNISKSFLNDFDTNKNTNIKYKKKNYQFTKVSSKSIAPIANKLHSKQNRNRRIVLDSKCMIPPLEKTDNLYADSDSVSTTNTIDDVNDSGYNCMKKNFIKYQPLNDNIINHELNTNDRFCNKNMSDKIELSTSNTHSLNKKYQNNKIYNRSQYGGVDRINNEDIIEFDEEKSIVLDKHTNNKCMNELVDNKNKIKPICDGMSGCNVDDQSYESENDMIDDEQIMKQMESKILGKYKDKIAVKKDDDKTLVYYLTRKGDDKKYKKLQYAQQQIRREGKMSATTTAKGTKRTKSDHSNNRREIIVEDKYGNAVKKVICQIGKCRKLYKTYHSWQCHFGTKHKKNKK